MSMILDACITCPSCGHSFDAKVYRSIWGEVPENRQLVFSDRVNNELCLGCGAQLKLPFALFYTNRDREFAVWYEPYHDPVVDEDARGYAEVYGADYYLACAPRVRDWDEFKSAIQDFEDGVGPTALDLIEFAERRYALDPRRLRQIELLRLRVMVDICNKGEQPPAAFLTRLLAMVDRGELPSPAVIANVIDAIGDDGYRKMLEPPLSFDVMGLGHISHLGGRRVQLNLLDFEVIGLCRFITSECSGNTPIAFFAVGTAVGRGVVLARQEPGRVDELWPSGSVIDPISGQPDTQTIEFLHFISSEEFETILEVRLPHAAVSTYSNLLSAYVSLVDVAETLDYGEPTYDAQLTAIVKHALLFGLWFGLRCPAHSDRILAEFSRRVK